MNLLIPHSYSILLSYDMVFHPSNIFYLLNQTLVDSAYCHNSLNAALHTFFLYHKAYYLIPYYYCAPLLYYFGYFSPYISEIHFFLQFVLFIHPLLYPRIFQLLPLITTTKASYLYLSILIPNYILYSANCYTYLYYSYYSYLI